MDQSLAQEAEGLGLADLWDAASKKTADFENLPSSRSAHSNIVVDIPPPVWAGWKLILS